MPKPPPRGRKPAVDFREILNAIRYMARSAGGWRMLPREFGPWQTVYWWFRRFVRRLLFRTIHDVVLMLDREQAGREGSPSGGVLDNLWSLSIACGNGTFGSSARPSRRLSLISAASTAAKRSSAASAMLQSIPTVGCSWST